MEPLDPYLDPIKGAAARSQSAVTGLLVIHSAPSALRSHIEWAIQKVLGTWVELTWKPQPLLPGTYRATLDFRDRAGSAAKIASALRSWHYLRFEVREEGASGGQFYRFVPDLGIHHATIDSMGSIVISENVVTSALAHSFDEDSLREAIATSLGTAWEDELEPLRGVELQEIARLKAI